MEWHAAPPIIAFVKTAGAVMASLADDFAKAHGPTPREEEVLRRLMSFNRLVTTDEVAELFAGVHAEFGVDGADVGAHGVDGQRLVLGRGPEHTGEERHLTRTGGVEALVNPKAKDEDLLALLKYIPADARMEKLLENQHVLMEPIVRNGKKATMGYKPEVWEMWG